MIELSNVSRSFGRTLALDRVTLRFEPGRVAALVGQNGAGKTTAMRVAAGFLRPDGGTVLVGGVPVSFPSPRAAAAAGIQMVHQHFMLVNPFTIGENIALARPPGSGGSIRSRLSSSVSLTPTELERLAREAVASAGIALEGLHRRVTDLSVGERAKLELIKALVQRPRLLILDEPTSVLTPPETAELARAVRRLAAEGVAVVIVTHKLPEVFELSDVVHVMRDGRVVFEEETSRSSPSRLAEAMMGAVRTPESPPSAGQPGQEILRCVRLSTPGLRGIGLSEIDLEVREGEIVGIVGVAGNGQVELAEVLRGLVGPKGGELRLRGTSVLPEQLAREQRIAHVPADRTREGIIAEMSVAENIALGDPARRTRRAVEIAERAIREFSVRATPQQPVGSLSGGNQQKVILAREFEGHPDLIIAAEPTRGLDIEATSFVHGRLRGAAARGAGVLLITSDLDEAFALSDVVQVLFRGHLSGRIAPAHGQQEVGRLMAGLA